MGKWIFAGIFCGIIAVAVIAYYVVRNKVRTFTRSAFGTDNISKIMTDINNDMDSKPKSLSGCDSLMRPKILRDFPDYDFTMAETYVKDHLKEFLGNKKGLNFHNIVIKNYEPSSIQKTIVYQAALEFRKSGQLVQKRYELNYSYIVPRQDAATVASNCPNCGGALKFGEVTCPYCGSRVVNILGNCWKFTDTYEK